MAIKRSSPLSIPGRETCQHLEESPCDGGGPSAVIKPPRAIEDLATSPPPTVSTLPTLSLHQACVEGKVEVVRNLLKEGSFDVDERNIRGYTPLLCACVWAHLDVIRCLTHEFGADLHAANCRGATALHAAARIGNASVIKFLLASGAIQDINKPDGHGSTPLHDAVVMGHLSAVQILVAYGAHVNVRKKDGTSALHLASKEPQPAIISFLIMHGANPNIRDDNGDSPLHLAAQAGSIEAVHELLDGGASKFVCNNRGEYPIDVAENEEIEVILFTAPFVMSSLKQLCISFVQCNRDSFDEVLDGTIPSSLIDHVNRAR